MFSKIKGALSAAWQWLKEQILTVRFVATVVINSLRLEMATMFARRSRRDESSQVISMQITHGVWSPVI